MSCIADIPRGSGCCRREEMVLKKEMSILKNSSSLFSVLANQVAKNSRSANQPLNDMFNRNN